MSDFSEFSLSCISDPIQQGATGMKNAIEKVLSGVVLLAAAAIFIIAHIYSRRRMQKAIRRYCTFEVLRPQISLRKL